MARINFDYRPDEIGEVKNFGDLLPAGDYLAAIVESGMKAPRKGGPDYIALVWQILEGSQKGRKFFDNLNCNNASDAAKEMSRASYKSLQIALNLRNEDMFETSNLHNLPCTLTLIPTKDKEGKDQRKALYRAVGSPPPAAAPSPPPVVSGEAATSTKKPWEQ
jgi:hypothetical protein